MDQKEANVSHIFNKRSDRGMEVQHRHLRKLWHTDHPTEHLKNGQWSVTDGVFVINDKRYDPLE